MVQPLGHLLGVGFGVPVKVMEQHQPAVAARVARESAVDST